jgi:hypothetical protein
VSRVRNGTPERRSGGTEVSPVERHQDDGSLNLAELAGKNIFAFFENRQLDTALKKFMKESRWIHR